MNFLRLISTAALVVASSLGALAADAAPTRIVTKLVAKTSDGKTVAEVLVDTHDTPDLAAWGRKAGNLCVEWLPKISALLASEGVAPTTNVSLVFKPGMKGVAATSGARITISADYVRGHTNDFGMVIHELTHVVQDYHGKGEGWLTEGIADYIRDFHFEPGKRRAHINADKASYRDGYGTTAAFLNWLETARHKGIVRALNAASREGKPIPATVRELTGKNLEELWSEFVTALKKPGR